MRGFGRRTGTRRATALSLVLLLAALVTPARGAEPVPTTYRGFDYGTATTSSPTADKPQSKLWYHDGAWWALMLDPADNQIHVFELQADHTWRSTSGVVDSRATSTGDALWDGTSLYVASRRASSPTLVNRLRYDSGTRTYTPDAGFPVTVTSGGTESVSIAKDSTGRLWVAYARSSRVWVSHTTTDDRTWVAPFSPAVPDTAVSSDDVASLIAFDGRIGVMWSNQVSQAFRFAVHVDGAPDTAWTSETPLAGTRLADDHLNLKSLSSDASGRIYAVVKTSRGDDPADPATDPLVVVLVRSATGQWSSVTAGTVADNHTRAVLVLDETNSEVYVVASAGSVVYYKRSPMSALSFPPGRGTPLVAWSGVSVGNPSTSKAPVSTATGLVVLASSTGTDHRYYHSELAVPDRLGPAAPTGLEAVAGAASVALTWDAAADNVGVVAYTVYRDGAAVGTSSTTSFADGTVVPGRSYGYAVDAVDAAGNRSPRSAPVTVTTGSDTEPPSAPTDLRTTAVGAGSVGLAWTASTDDTGVAGYAVLRDGTVVGSPSGPGFTDAGLTPETAYDYTVRARDLAGNLSPATETLPVTTTADTTAPSRPGQPTSAAATATTLSLTWTASTDDVRVQAYELRRADGTLVATTSLPSWTDTGLLPQTTYTYYVTALDEAGNRSTDSLIGSATTQPRLVSFVASTARQNELTSSLTLTRPSGTAAGTTLVATVTTRGVPRITAPAGWALLRRDASGTSLQQAVYLRQADVADPASWTWTFSAARSAAGTVLRYAGVDPAAPVDVTGGQASTTTSTSLTAPSVVTSTPNATLVGLYALSRDAAVTPPAVMTERAELAITNLKSKLTVEAADGLWPTPGATGPFVAKSTKTGYSIGQVVALRPAT